MPEPMTLEEAVQLCDDKDSRASAEQWLNATDVLVAHARATLAQRREEVTETIELWFLDGGDFHTYSRGAKDEVVISYREDVPESLYDDAASGCFMVFDGEVHGDTLNQSDEALEARGLPTSASRYDEWWVGEFRDATDAEILAVFSNTPALAASGEGGHR